MTSTMTRMSVPTVSDELQFDFERDIGSIRQRRFRHPTAALFHVAFKIAAVFVYLFGGFFFHEAFIGIYVAIILLVSMDFWTVKNVTGRLMVGLRWWNFIDEEGNSHWVFENKRKHQATNSALDETTSADTSLFWAALIINPIVWFFLLLVAVFRLNVQYFMIVALALILSGSNLYGYVRCRMGTQDIKSTLTQYATKQILFNFMSGGSKPKPAQVAPSNPVSPFSTA